MHEDSLCKVTHPNINNGNLGLQVIYILLFIFLYIPSGH